MAPRNATTTTPNRAARRHPDAPPVVPLFISLAEAGIRVGLCERTVRRAISTGELRGFKFGKAVRVRLDDLDLWAESKTIPNARSTRPSRPQGKAVRP